MPYVTGAFLFNVSIPTLGAVLGEYCAHLVKDTMGL